MTIRGILFAILLSVAGILSAGVTLFGVAAVIGVDLRQDTFISCLYCGLPLLCFPVFLLVRPRNRSTFLLSLMALVYLAAYSALNFRTCSELGYCVGFTVTVMQTLSTNMVLAFFAVVILSLLLLLIDDRSTLWQPKH
jgi:hypothetical protein